MLGYTPATLQEFAKPLVVAELLFCQGNRKESAVFACVCGGLGFVVFFCVAEGDALCTAYFIFVGDSKPFRGDEWDAQFPQEGERSLRFTRSVVSASPLPSTTTSCLATAKASHASVCVYFACYPFFFLLALVMKKCILPGTSG